MWVVFLAGLALPAFGQRMFPREVTREELDRRASHVVVGQVVHVYERVRALPPAGHYVDERFCIELGVRKLDRGSGPKRGEVIYLRFGQTRRDPQAPGAKLFVPPSEHTRVRVWIKKMPGGNWELVARNAIRPVPFDAKNVTRGTMQETLDLLEDWRRDIMSSLVRAGPQPDSEWLLRILGPVEELEELIRRREPVLVEHIGGTFFGPLAKDLAPKRFTALLVGLLTGEDTEGRVFACETLAAMGAADAADRIAALLVRDDERAALYAAFALTAFGRPDGLPRLVRYARANPRHWTANVLPAFRRISKEDHGKDLDAWERHFRARKLIK
ncbi:MAG: hypothetical protein CMJ83_02650 [Planctomycetes bacterium]|nr:hypothetical protein [Planctomycetota bacterium]